ncbi:MAG: glycosyltransferase [Lachnoclostridium sp.]|nr:glycosyltransferase [Lachnoclostridium sp.]
MDITVIVAAYNSGKTIARTLDAILRQKTSAEYEILIGDDCSKDDTVDICRRYELEYPDKIRIIARPENLGILGNYFDCVRQARGRYIADCAADDFWIDENKLQRQFEILEAEPDVSIVLTEWQHFDENTAETSSHEGAIVTRRTDYNSASIIPDILTHKLQFHLCTALYRKKTVTDMMARHPRLMTDPDFSCEDQQILLTMATKGTIVLLPEVTLNYSVGHESISHSVDYKKKFEYSIKALAQSKVLSDYFCPGDKSVSEYYRKCANHIAAMALRSLSADCYRRLLAFESTTGIYPGIKGKIYINIMRCRPIWLLAAYLLNHRK